jgi:hypothetical protein
MSYRPKTLTTLSRRLRPNGRAVDEPDTPAAAAAVPPVPANGALPAQAGASAPESEQARDVAAVVTAGLAAVRRVGRFSAAAVAEGADTAARVLTKRVTGSAVTAPRAVPDQVSLARALADQPGLPTVGTATITAVVARAASRLTPLRFLARRTPLWFLAVAGPAFYATVSRGADELGLVASNLVHRARAAGVDPDPERVRRAAVQLVSGREVDPDTDPRHGSLAVQWMRRAVRAMLPFSRGVGSGHPGRLAESTAAVRPVTLAPQSRAPQSLAGPAADRPRR